MYRMFAGAALALVMVVVTASAKEYKNAMIVKVSADDDSITVKFEGSDKEVTIKLNDKTTYSRIGKDGTEKEAKKEIVSATFAKAKNGVKSNIITEGDDKEDPAKDKLTAKKVVITISNKNNKGKTKDL